MSKLFSIIISFILIKGLLSSLNKTSLIKSKNLTKYEKLINWGLNNSLNLSEDLTFSKNKFIAEKFITIDDIIMTIPKKLMLSVKSALELLNSSKLKKQYELYLKEDQESAKKKQTIFDEAHIDQSFLSYLLYVISHKKKKYSKTDFYKYYEHISYMFEDNLDNLPFSYSSEQMNLFTNTTFGPIFESCYRYFSDEASLFEKKFYQKPIIFEDYLKYRIFSVKKYYNISNEVNLVPFIDLIKQDHKEPNCIYYDEGGDIKLKAILNVFPGEELILKPLNISNQHRLIFFGETFDEILDVFPSYSVPVMPRYFLFEEKVEIDNDLDDKLKKYDVMDLCEDEFYKNVEDIYSEVTVRINKKHKGEIHALRFLVKYLKKLRKNLDYVDDIKIRNSFYSRKDMDNAIRIFKGERMFMDKKIKEVRDYMKKFRKFKKILDKSDNGVIDIDDL